MSRTRMIRRLFIILLAAPALLLSMSGDGEAWLHLPNNSRSREKFTIEHLMPQNWQAQWQLPVAYNSAWALTYGRTLPTTSALRF